MICLSMNSLLTVAEATPRTPQYTSVQLGYLRDTGLKITLFVHLRYLYQCNGSINLIHHVIE